MMRLLKSSVVALLLAGCVGLPDRVDLEVGRGHGSFESPSGRNWDDDTGWAAATLSFPITYAVAPARSESSPAALVPLELELPWWEDIAQVQTLVIALAGAGAAVAARPAYRKTRELCRREEKSE
jgi:hypothetical protein